MASDNEVLQLTEELLIGNGYHKSAYCHPFDEKLCIKILHFHPDTDMERELGFRNACKKRIASSVLLPQYFGTIPTNLGEGHVYERVCNYDGSTSKTLKEFLNAPPRKN